MYELKLYTYLEGTWTRNTVTSKAIPDDERLGTHVVAWGDPELEELYNSDALKCNVLNLTLSHNLFTPSRGMSQMTLKQQVARTVQFYVSAAEDIKNANDSRVGGAWINRLQNSVCRGIVASLERIGVHARIKHVDVRNLSNTDSAEPHDFKAWNPEALKTWRHIECTAEDSEGVELRFNILPMFDQFVYRCGLIGNLLIGNSLKAHRILYAFGEGENRKLCHNLLRVSFQNEGCSVVAP